MSCCESVFYCRGEQASSRSDHCGRDGSADSIFWLIHGILRLRSHDDVQQRQISIATMADWIDEAKVDSALMILKELKEKRICMMYLKIMRLAREHANYLSSLCISNLKYHMNLQT